MQIKLRKDHEGIPVHPKLEPVVIAMGLAMPSLDFLSTKATRRGLESDPIISDFDVYDGEQFLGRFGYVRQYSRSKGYEDVYRIHSHKIKKSRGDRNAKTTRDAKTAVKIAKDVFKPLPPSDRARQIFGAFREVYDGILWSAGARLRDLHNAYRTETFDYVLSIVDGSPQPINPKLLQELQSEKFREMRDTYRIAQAVSCPMKESLGALVYQDRNEALTVIDLETFSLTKLSSTYDLPTNYQEKYTILKVMEFNQPIDGMGVKLKIEIDDEKFECCYLVPGSTIVTH
jgi:hypothetical protein